MKEKNSIRGRAARHVVRLANHIPLYKGNAMELRMKLSERERLWQCPPHLELVRIQRPEFGMELLRARSLQQDEGKEAGEGTADKEPLTDGRPARGMILQLHGGGYYGKLKNAYRNMAGLYYEISNGFDVLSVDYRVAPKNPFPAALYDALDAYQWILEQGYPPEKLFVVGDSAGGGLALALVMYLRDHGMVLPRGIITMSAWTDLTKSGASYEENLEIDPVFGGGQDSIVYQEGYYGMENPENPYISPAMGDFRSFPPMLLQVGEYEMLLSDTLTVEKKAKEAGVMVKEHTYPGMFHVFQMGLLYYPEAKEAWREAGIFIRKLSR